MNKMIRKIAMSLVAAGILAAPVAFAQTQTEQPTSPSMNSDEMQGMMQGGDMMGMMTQMNEMMQTCNEMMKAMQSDKETPAGEGAQPNNG
ncbi:hypothetical protein [Pseudaminobacter sp. NGMCC 1.201702]|uniref:hypothetical protein n=1 Tax=Pseudaminobacter sp. NGMCC 1.201702 TaxID=3391825 RepID=UPI0039EECF22